MGVGLLLQIEVLDVVAAVWEAGEEGGNRQVVVELVSACIVLQGFGEGYDL